jgi:hypothetical protein
MEKISRSVPQAKQAKNNYVECTSPYSLYSPYGLTWQGRIDRMVMTWQSFIG